MWGREVKNRKVRLPGWATDKHGQTSTHTHLYTLTCLHTRGIKRPSWPSKGWWYRYDLQPPPPNLLKGWTICRVNERRNIKVLVFTSQPEMKHCTLYSILIIILSLHNETEASVMDIRWCPHMNRAFANCYTSALCLSTWGKRRTFFGATTSPSSNIWMEKHDRLPFFNNNCYFWAKTSPTFKRSWNVTDNTRLRF